LDHVQFLREYERRLGTQQWAVVSDLIRNEDQPVLSAEHYGTEFHAARVTEEEIAFVRSVLPGDAIVNILDD
jgi:hypothetical protein